MEAFESRDGDVTVLMPVHGDAPFIEMAIESVLAQHCAGALELLIVLDRASKQVEEWLADWSDPRLRVISSDVPGLVGALNTGLAAAAHGLIARMDADDIMLQDRLRYQAAVLVENPSLMAVGGQVLICDRDGNLTATGRYPCSTDSARKRARHQSPLAHPAVMFRRDAVLRVGGYNADYPHAEDYDLWRRLLNIGDLANLNRWVLVYREHPDQVSQTRAQQLARDFSRAQAAYERWPWNRYRLRVARTAQVRSGRGSASRTSAGTRVLLSTIWAILAPGQAWRRLLLRRAPEPQGPRGPVDWACGTGRTVTNPGND